MGYSDQQLLSSIRTGYKDPYHTSVITKAKRKDINIDVPSYGKGYYKNAYQNIVRNASQVIALAWGQAEQEVIDRDKHAESLLGMAEQIKKEGGQHE